MMSFKSLFVRRDYIIEAKSGEMLDISIPNADKVFANKEHEMFQNEYTIEEKTDGVKLTLFRNNKPYDAKDFTNNWTVGWKNNILHPSEFKLVTSKKVKEHGIGVSQYKLVFDHLKMIHNDTKEIPTNTEFLIEFLMKKPTLTRDYEHNHGMILIGYAHNVDVDFKNDFRLYTKKTKLNQKLNQHYADVLKLDLPSKMFEGSLQTFDDFKRGAINPELIKTIRKHKKEVEEAYQRENWKHAYEVIKDLFLTIPSAYGGRIEGVVMKDKSTGRMYKMLQSDQHDKEVRQLVKQRYNMDKDEQNAYYNELRKIADNILKVVDTSGSHHDTMIQISRAIKKEKLPKNLHTKKNDHQIKEDLHLTVKLKYEKMLNPWAGVIGKFRIVTKEHVKMIEYALEKYKGATVMIVMGRRESELAEVSKEILDEIFKGKPVETFIAYDKKDSEGNVKASSGNIVSLETKTRHPIVAYVCGPDRKPDYMQQLKKANSDAVVDVYDSGKREEVSASNAELFLRRNDMQQVEKIVHPVAYKNLNKWEKFYK